LRLPARARFIRMILPLAASVAVLAATAPAADAGALASAAVSCSSYTFQYPFAPSPWSDYHAYTLAPGGSFETSTWGTGWTLSGGAKRVAGNESWYVHARSDAYSLALPAGSSATTRAMCTASDYPWFRFFLRNTGSAASTLKVEVLWEDLAGALHATKVANLTAASTWHASDQLHVLMDNLANTSASGTSPIALRFTPQGSGGSWQIDDLYVDPYKRT